jgi:hypothetical protein
MQDRIAYQGITFDDVLLEPRSWLQLGYKIGCACFMPSNEKEAGTGIRTLDPRFTKAVLYR